MAKEKKSVPEKVFTTDPLELARKAEAIGAENDNPPVNLDRGSYVQGAISFGSLVLDLITGGGMPPGKIGNTYGLPGSSKSTCSYHLISSAIKLGIPVFLFDHEASADSKYLHSLGIKIRLKDGTKNPLFNYFQPTTAEATYRVISRLLSSMPDYTPGPGGRPFPPALFLIDSLAAMLPEAIEEDDENIRMAAQAAVHSQFMPLIKSKLGRKNCSLFATNQTRLKPGVMYGNPEYEPGGQAVDFYPDLKIRFQAVGKVFEERNRSMRYVNISTKKNKQFVPFLECKDTLAVAFGRGYERGRDAYGYLQLTGQLEAKGSRKLLNMQLDGENFDWNGKSYQSVDELMALFCTNAFRDVCRSQIESGTAFKMYFAANNWEDVYAVDEEAAADEVNPLKALKEQYEEAEALPVPKKKRGRRAADEESEMLEVINRD
jgi:RecA/RadA recombinase